MLFLRTLYGFLPVPLVASGLPWKSDETAGGRHERTTHTHAPRAVWAVPQCSGVAMARSGLDRQRAVRADVRHSARAGVTHAFEVPCARCDLRWSDHSLLRPRHRVRCRVRFPDEALT